MMLSTLIAKMVLLSTAAFIQIGYMYKLSSTALNLKSQRDVILQVIHKKIRSQRKYAHTSYFKQLCQII